LTSDSFKLGEFLKLNLNIVKSFIFIQSLYDEYGKYDDAENETNLKVNYDVRKKNTFFVDSENSLVCTDFLI
jgi:hypothetical protein